MVPRRDAGGAGGHGGGQEPGEPCGQPGAQQRAPGNGNGGCLWGVHAVCLVRVPGSTGVEFDPRAQPVRLVGAQDQAPAVCSGQLVHDGHAHAGAADLRVFGGAPEAGGGSRQLGGFQPRPGIGDLDDGARTPWMRTEAVISAPGAYLMALFSSSPIIWASSIRLQASSAPGSCAGGQDEGVSRGAARRGAPGRLPRRAPRRR